MSSDSQKPPAKKNDSSTPEDPSSPPLQEGAAPKEDFRDRLARELEALAVEEDPAEAPKPRKRAMKAAAPAKAAPIHRSREEVEERRRQQTAEPSPSGEEPQRQIRPGRSPASPTFGRFIGGQVAKRQLSELTPALLAELLSELRANERLLATRLDAIYAKEGGGPIGPADVSKLVRERGLEEAFTRLERRNLVSLLRQSRGFLAPLRRILGLSASQLRERIARYDLEPEIRELQEHLREEARSDLAFEERLRLATSRADALRAVGELRQLDERNLAPLKEALEEALEGETKRIEEPQALLELARRALGLEPPLWQRVVAHYQLPAEAARLLGLPIPPPEETSPRPRGGPGKGPHQGPPPERRWPGQTQGRGPAGPRHREGPPGPSPGRGPAGPGHREGPPGPSPGRGPAGPGHREGPPGPSPGRGPAGPGHREGPPGLSQGRGPAGPRHREGPPGPSQGRGPAGPGHREGPPRPSQGRGPAGPRHREGPPGLSQGRGPASPMERRRPSGPRPRPPGRGPKPR